MTRPTRERVMELLDYDSSTGVFRWCVAPNNRVKVGSIAGYVRPKGHRYIEVDGHPCAAHHLAWLYVHDVWPATDIDHRNGRPDDNRISNLREDLEAKNGQNRHRPSRRNTSGFLGVSLHRASGKWVAHIWAEGRNLYLGLWPTPEEASAAYQAAKRELHPFWDEGAI